MKYIKIYGERNTNTNYLSRLIKLNLYAEELPGVVPYVIMKMMPRNELIRDIYFFLTYHRNLGWKHSRVKNHKKLKAIHSDLAIITITKNPYSWLLSLYRRPYHQYYQERIDFETFLQREWKTVGRDNVKVPLNSPIDLWNIKNSSYLEIKKNVINLTSEDIIKGPNDVINKISCLFSIAKKNTFFTDYTDSTKDKSKNNDYYKDYYINEKWRKEITENEFSIINEKIDMRIMSHFNYKLIN